MNDVVRRGIYALPAAGIVTALPWPFIFAYSSRQSDHDAYARGLTSPVHLISFYLYMAGLICLLFGLLALYRYLARTRGSAWAARGMILSVIGIALALPVVGLLGLADTVIADAYLGGNKDAYAVLTKLSGGTFSDRINNYFGVLVLFSLAGAIAYAIAVWRSGTLSKWAGIVVAIGFVCSITLTPIVAWVGALCLLVGGIVLARSIDQTSTTYVERTSLGPQPSAP